MWQKGTPAGIVKISGVRSKCKHFTDKDVPNVINKIPIGAQCSVAGCQHVKLAEYRPWQGIMQFQRYVWKEEERG